MESKMRDVFEEMEKQGHEQVIFFVITQVQVLKRLLPFMIPQWVLLWVVVVWLITLPQMRLWKMSTFIAGNDL